jgi:hypothetical protein
LFAEAARERLKIDERALIIQGDYLKGAERGRAVPLSCLPDDLRRRARKKSIFEVFI